MVKSPLVYVNDADILGGRVHNVNKTEALVVAIKENGLELNSVKTSTR